MPELTHDTAEDGFHEIQLSGKQLIFLLMMTTSVLVFTFLCGVLVGRGVTAERGLASDVTSSSPTASTPSTPAADAGPPAAEPPAPPPDDELSYHSRLQNAPVQEKKPEPAAEPPAVPPPAQKPAASEPPRAGADVPTSGKPGTWFVQVHALQNRAAASDIVKGLIAKGYPAYLENPAPGAPAIYRVRIGRYGDRSEADQVARRLQKEEQFKPEVRR